MCSRDAGQGCDSDTMQDGDRAANARQRERDGEPEGASIAYARPRSGREMRRSRWIRQDRKARRGQGHAIRRQNGWTQQGRWQQVMAAAQAKCAEKQGWAFTTLAADFTFFTLFMRKAMVALAGELEEAAREGKEQAASQARAEQGRVQASSGGAGGADLMAEVAVTRRRWRWWWFRRG